MITRHPYCTSGCSPTFAYGARQGGARFVIENGSLRDLAAGTLATLNGGTVVAVNADGTRALMTSNNPGPRWLILIDTRTGRHIWQIDDTFTDGFHVVAQPHGGGIAIAVRLDTAQGPPGPERLEIVTASPTPKHRVITADLIGMAANP